MTVYHPRSWLREMPVKPRFYATKEALRADFPTLPPSEIVTAAYSGPCDETTIVFSPVTSTGPVPAKVIPPVIEPETPIAPVVTPEPEAPAPKAPRKNTNAKTKKTANA